MKKRLFIALDMPTAPRVELARLCTGLPGARWTPASQMHLTLCFLGETEGSAFLDLREALADIRAEAFSLGLRGLGFFPPRGTPRVLWAGIKANPALLHLQARVLACVRRLGLPLEQRKFLPHITLARLSEASLPKLQGYLSTYALFSVPAFPMQSFCLYSSLLGRAGATHLVEAEYELGPACSATDPDRHKKSGLRTNTKTAESAGGDERN